MTDFGHDNRFHALHCSWVHVAKRRGEGSGSQQGWTRLSEKGLLCIKPARESDKNVMLMASFLVPTGALAVSAPKHIKVGRQA